MTALHPEILTDPDGKRLSVQLPLAEYEVLLARLEGLEDLEDACKALGEPSIPGEIVKAEMDDDERALWSGLSLSGLAGASGEDEPAYGPADIRQQ